MNKLLPFQVSVRLNFLQRNVLATFRRYGSLLVASGIRSERNGFAVIANSLLLKIF